MPLLQPKRSITITDGVNGTVDLSETVFIYYVGKTAILTVNWGVNPTGTAIQGMQCQFRVYSDVTLNPGVHVYFFSVQVPDEYALKQYSVDCYYNGTTWEVRITPDFEETGIITSGQIVNLAVTTGKINDKAVTLDKMADGTAGAMLYYNAVTARPVELVAGGAGRILQLNAGNTAPQWSLVSGHITMAVGGAVTIANTVVTRGMWTALARGNIIRGQVGNVATDYNAATNTQILIGDGNDINSVPVTGVIAITNAGVTSFGAAVVATAAMTDLTSACLWVGSGTNRPTERAITGAIAISNTGVTSVNNYQITEQIYGYVPLGGDACPFAAAASYTVPANTWSADGYFIKLIAHGITAGNVNAKPITMLFNGNVIASNTTTASPNNLPWIWEAYIYRTDVNNWKSVSSIIFNGVASQVAVNNGAGIDFSATPYAVAIATAAAAADVTLESFEVVLYRS